MFCEKCGALLMPKDGKMACPQCGKVSKSDGKMVEKQEKKELVIMNKKDTEMKYPEIDQDCEKCECTRCYFWAMQTRSSDEPETKFYKCVKCGHTWREDD